MLKKYKNKFIVFTLALAGIIFFSNFADASTINIVASSQPRVYDVMLSVDEGDSINAAEGTIIFNESAFLAPKIQKTDSIIPFWIKAPEVSGNSITFSGIIPGGFSVLYDQFGGTPKNEAKLFSIVFPYDPTVSFYNFTLDSTIIYRNDGLGTAISIPTKTFTLRAEGGSGGFFVNSSPGENNPSPHLGVFFLAFCGLILIVYFFLTKIAPIHIRHIKNKKK